MSEELNTTKESADSSQAEYECGNCGADITENDQVCPKCGTDLSETAENEKQENGFNFGAGFLAPIWFISHGKPGLGILFLIYSFLISQYHLPNFEANLVMMIINLAIILFCGLKGNEIAMKYKGYSSIEETKEKEQGWNIAGITISIIATLLILYSL